MVEFALILFPLLLIVAGIIQFGIGLNYWLDMQRIANQGARGHGELRPVGDSASRLQSMQPIARRKPESSAGAHHGTQEHGVRRDPVPVEGQHRAYTGTRVGDPSTKSGWRVISTSSHPRRRPLKLRSRCDDATRAAPERRRWSTCP